MDPGQSWRAHCWKQARAGLVKRLPIEIVRRRVVRARELGLAYPAYASILLGSGRDIVGFLFTADAIGLRLQKGLPPLIDTAAAAKLTESPAAARVLMAPRWDDLASLLHQQGIPFSTVATAPRPGASDPEARSVIRTALGSLPGDAVVMIGARGDERRWAAAARLAQFIAAPTYFAAREAGA